MPSGQDSGITMLEYHVLLALSGGPLHGYAIKNTVAEDSGGTQTARAGSFYRVLARLMTDGLVKEAAPKGEHDAHPGRERRYYALTAAGRQLLAAEARRLKQTAAVAERRLGVTTGRS
jgi:DNA-binding PadR family transcriptional regulator